MTAADYSRAAEYTCEYTGPESTRDAGRLITAGGHTILTVAFLAIIQYDIGSSVLRNCP